jgi:hypothetical protein
MNLDDLKDLLDDLEFLGSRLDVLWESLGSGVWLEPGDYEALKEQYNVLAQAAEDVCIVGRRMFDD